MGSKSEAWKGRNQVFGSATRSAVPPSTGIATPTDPRSCIQVLFWVRGSEATVNLAVIPPSQGFVESRRGRPHNVFGCIAVAVDVALPKCQYYP
jgi:hypothetical protein